MNDFQRLRIKVDQNSKYQIDPPKKFFTLQLNHVNKGILSHVWDVELVVYVLINHAFITLTQARYSSSISMEARKKLVYSV